MQLSRTRILALTLNILLNTTTYAISTASRQPRSETPLQWRHGGNYKSILSLQHLKHTNIFQRDWVPVAEQRLRLSATPSYYNWTFEYAGETSLFTQLNNASTIPVPDLSPTPWWNARYEMLSSSTWLIVHRIDRMNLQWNWNEFEVRVGKQVVPMGVGHIFNAVSQIPRQPFIQVDPEFQRTEDAVSFAWKKNLVLEARFLPRTVGQRNHNFHIRAKGSKNGYDIALTGGRSDDKVFIGLETAGNLGEGLLRGELVGYDAYGTSYVQALAGYDRAFNPEWSAEFEIFYNGFGSAKATDYAVETFRHRSSPYRGRYYLGSTVRWEFHQLWKASAYLVFNLTDPSLLLNAFVNRSLTDSVDVLFGQILNIGFNPTSEFGGRLPILSVPGSLAVGLPDLTYVALRYYF